MTFAEIPEQGEFSEFKPVQFTKIVSGIPLRLRILDTKAHRIGKHFIQAQRVSVLCLGDTCPICANNRKLIDANPGVQYNTISGFNSRQNRYLVNVYNRTMVKVSPSGNIVYPGLNGQFPPQSAEGEILSNIPATALNRVEVLERGPTLFAQLNSINDTMLDDDGKPLGLTNYDVVITATGKGRQMTTNVIPYIQGSDKVEIPEEDLNVLEDVPLRLEPDELSRLLGGTSLRDIFEMRKSGGIEAEKTDIENQVSDTVDNLFDEENAPF